jgi:Na+-driven multidrug efflux pump
MLLAILAFAPVAALTLRYHWLGLPGIWTALGLWLAARSALLGYRWREATRSFGKKDPYPERARDSSAT